MQIIIKENDKQEAKRLLSCDLVFILISELDNKLRSYQKYETDKTRDEVIDELREMIHEDNLLDLWQ